jgi:hypothetical protein
MPRNDQITVQDLASPAGRPTRARRRPHDCHLADCGDVELETLATVQTRSVYDLHLRQLVIPVADAVDGLRAKMDAAPEFTDPKFSRFRNGANVSIAANRQNARGADR